MLTTLNNAPSPDVHSLREKLLEPIKAKENRMGQIEEVTAELQKIPWFQELKEEHVRRIAEISTIRHVKAGEIIFREGDTHESVYVVIDGRVGLEMYVPHRGKVRFYTADRWEIFGWSSVTPNVHLRTAGAVAVLD